MDHQGSTTVNMFTYFCNIFPMTPSNKHGMSVTEVLQFLAQWDDAGSSALPRPFFYLYLNSYCFLFTYQHHAQCTYWCPTYTCISCLLINVLQTWCELILFSNQTPLESVILLTIQLKGFDDIPPHSTLKVSKPEDDVKHAVAPLMTLRLYNSSSAGWP